MEQKIEQPIINFSTSLVTKLEEVSPQKSIKSASFLKTIKSSCDTTARYAHYVALGTSIVCIAANPPYRFWFPSTDITTIIAMNCPNLVAILEPDQPLYLDRVVPFISGALQLKYGQFFIWSDFSRNFWIYTLTSTSGLSLALTVTSSLLDKVQITNNDDKKECLDLAHEHSIFTLNMLCRKILSCIEDMAS